MTQGEACPKLVVSRKEGEPVVDLELPLVVGDGQPPGLAECTEGRVVDPKMSLERAAGQVRAPVEVVVGVLEAELVDPALSDDGDDGADRGVALHEPPRLLPDEVRHARVVREVVAQGEGVPVARPVVQLAEQDQVVGLPEELPARGAAVHGVGGGGPVVVRPVSGHQLGESREDRVVLSAAADVVQVRAGSGRFGRRRGKSACGRAGSARRGTRPSCSDGTRPPRSARRPRARRARRRAATAAAGPPSRRRAGRRRRSRRGRWCRSS